MSEEEVDVVLQEMWERGWRDHTIRLEVGTLDITGKVFTPYLPPDEWSITATRRNEKIVIRSVAEWERLKQLEAQP